MEPLQALVNPRPFEGAARLDEPALGPQRREMNQAQRLGDLGDAHRPRQVLLVREDEEDGLGQLVLRGLSRGVGAGHS